MKKDFTVYEKIYSTKMNTSKQQRSVQATTLIDINHRKESVETEKLRELLEQEQLNMYEDEEEI
jgi:hypothetical protein